MSTFPHQPNTTLQIDIEMKPWNKIHIQNGVEQKVLEMLKTPLFQFEIYCCGVWLPCQGRKCKMSTKENTFSNNYCAKYFYNLVAWNFSSFLSIFSLEHFQQKNWKNLYLRSWNWDRMTFLHQLSSTCSITPWSLKWQQWCKIG